MLAFCLCSVYLVNTKKPTIKVHGPMKLNKRSNNEMYFSHQDAANIELSNTLQALLSIVSTLSPLVQRRHVNNLYSRGVRHLACGLNVAHIKD